MKNLIKLLVILPIFWSSSLFALGLGNETLHSSLGEKLFLEFPIIGVDQIDTDLLKFSVASAEAYQRMGVDFHQSHQFLKFSVVADDSGGLTLLITSKKPIKEPFLNFIIDMSSPSSQLLKEVSILLDTP